MSKVYKFTFYVTDPNDDYDAYDIADQISDSVECRLGCVMSDITIQHGNDEFEWHDEIPLNFSDCPLSEWERYMKPLD